MSKLTKMDKLYKILSDGENHAVSTIKRRTGLGSVSAGVRDLRADGYMIYLNTRGTNGNKRNFYRMDIAA